MNDLQADNKDWLDLFVIELRLLEVSGTNIGDALASTQEFLFDSGQRADEAFGTPQQYAAALGLPTMPQAKAPLNGDHLRSCMGVIGLLLITQAVVPLAHGEKVGFGPTVLVIFGGVIFVVVLLPLLVPVVIRFALRKGRWSLAVAILLGGAVGAMLGGSLPLLDLWLGSQPLFRVPALPLVLVAGILVVAPALWNQLRHGPVEDPIVDPVRPRPAGAVNPRWARAMLWGVNWMMAIGALILCAAMLGIDAVAG